MKKIILGVCLLMVAACSKTDPYDKVRILRRNFRLELDITVSKTDEIQYEINVQNLNSNTDLQDLTVDVRLQDENQNVLWENRKVLDVLGLASYSQKSFAFKVQGPEGIYDKYAFQNLVLAPDDANSDFMSYKEFMRVIK